MDTPQETVLPATTGLDPAARELGGTEAIRYRQQVQSGDFSEFRSYLERTRQERDWQDCNFILNLIAPFAQTEALRASSAAEPESRELWLLSGAHIFSHIAQVRGTRTAEQTSEEQFSAVSQQLPTMIHCLQKAAELAPEDPVPHLFAMRGLMIFSDHQDIVQQEYAAGAQGAPECVPLHYAMINARSKKWGGSHEESLSRARAAVRTAARGSDMPACLFLAHFFVWQYAKAFDNDAAKAERYLKDRQVNEELNQAFTQWITPDYRPQRSSISYLHQAALWYYLRGDTERLRQLIALTNHVPYDDIWRQLGNAQKHYLQALQQAAGQSQPPVNSKKGGLFGWLKR